MPTCRKARRPTEILKIHDDFETLCLVVRASGIGVSNYLPSNPRMSMTLIADFGASLRG
jgi:hypothetical protein